MTSMDGVGTEASAWAAGTPGLEGRIARLAAEIRDEGVPVLDGVPDVDATLEELAYALRPPVHERRIPTYGAVVVPAGTARVWAKATGIPVEVLQAHQLDPALVRMLADGLSTFALRCAGGITHLIAFDRMLSDEVTLVRLQEAAGGVIVQRHPSGNVRAFGPSGLVRWDGNSWYHEPPVGGWVAALAAPGGDHDPEALRRLLAFAVHELSPRSVGATLICRDPESPTPDGGWELRYPAPPELSILTRGGTAAIRHLLSQVDGATIFAHNGDLVAAGVRLVPSVAAEAAVAPLGGTRHTAAIRYSLDDPAAVVVVVSEDGPVTVMKGGDVVASASESVCRGAHLVHP